MPTELPALPPATGKQTGDPETDQRPGNRPAAQKQTSGPETEMRARSSLLLLIAAGLVAAGCVSKPAEEPQVATERPCGNSASGVLHMTSAAAVQQQDAEIESLLTQQTDDRRLQQINRRMYQSLHSLDAELRREQRLVACQQPSFSAPSLEAGSNNKSGTDAGSSNGAGGGGGVGGGGVVGASAAAGGLSSGGTVAANTGAATASGAAARSTTSTSSITTSPGGSTDAGRAGTLRKSSPSARGGGGNGATAQKVLAGSDNDVVARRLRRAAEQETNPALRAKLWKEYMDYRQGTSAK